MIFGRLRAGSKKDRREHLFRIFGYGAIILLLGFLCFSFLPQSFKWSKATGEMLANVLWGIVVSGLTALAVLSWLQTEEETRGQTLLAIIKLWPMFALCLPSLLGLVLLLFSLSIAENKTLSWRLFDFYGIWFLLVAPFATSVAFFVFVKLQRTGRVAIFPALLACAVLTACVLANLFALLVLLFTGMSGSA